MQVAARRAAAFNSLRSRGAQPLCRLASLGQRQQQQLQQQQQYHQLVGTRWETGSKRCGVWNQKRRNSTPEWGGMSVRAFFSWGKGEDGKASDDDDKEDKGGKGGKAGGKRQRRSGGGSDVFSGREAAEETFSAASATGRSGGERSSEDKDTAVAPGEEGPTSASGSGNDAVGYRVSSGNGGMVGEGGGGGGGGEAGGGEGGDTTPVTLGIGDHSPRYPRLIGLPVTRRPLFPGTVHPYTVTCPEVLEAVVKAKEEGHPYLGVFLRKDSAQGFFRPDEDHEHMHGRGLSGLSGLAGGHATSSSNPGHMGGGGSSSSSGAQQEGGDEDGSGPRPPAGPSSYPEIITDIDDIYRVGTFAQVHQIIPLGTGAGGMTSAQLLLIAHRRLAVRDVLSMGPPLEVSVDHWSRGNPFDPNSDVIKAYCQEIVATIRDVVKLNPLLREHMSFFSQRIDIQDPFKLADFAAAMTTADGEALQRVLEEMRAEERLRMALELLSKERELSRVQQEIQRQVEEKMSKQQRTYFLQEQLKSIKKELGLEKDDKEALLTRYRERLDGLSNVGEAAQKAIEDELEKLSSLEKNSPEFNTTRNYLDWLTQLPWGKMCEENLDIRRAKTILDEDHYGLEDVKKRILEFIAVGKLRKSDGEDGGSDGSGAAAGDGSSGTGSGSGHGKIICFVGPPGVGKTSVGSSIARALNRKFYRFSVGGLTDVAEIKGHRRTYVGAMPGKLIQCLKATGSANPLVLIDEVDKMGKGYQGDPASALLEVLDPSQNGAFVDHYLDVPVDLSGVLFICTANVLDTIPGPLRDRMEVIRLSGYDLPEKIAISEQYLIPKAKKDHGLTERDEVPASLGLTREAVDSLIRWYCREAGVRNLEQHISKIYRKLALEVVELQESSADEQQEEKKKKKKEEEEEAEEGKEASKSKPPSISSLLGGGGGDKDKDKEMGKEKEKERETWLVDAKSLSDYVGKPLFQSDRLYEGETLPPGVVTGLAWTAMGGSCLYIETAAISRGGGGGGGVGGGQRSGEESGEEDGGLGGEEGGRRGERRGRGGGGLKSTGQMGSVMNESVSIAHTYARNKLAALAPLNEFFDDFDLHMHVPEGATPKDGPSAGITMVTGMLSLALDRPIRANVAMTGELSLTGKVLAVGGIKEKTIAARRSGVDCLILPRACQRDYDELPDYLKEGLDVHFASTYDDVYAVVFE